MTSKMLLTGPNLVHENRLCHESNGHMKFRKRHAAQSLRQMKSLSNALQIIEALKREETVRYLSPDGIWDFSSKKLPEKPKKTRPASIWFDEAGYLFNKDDEV